MTATIIPIRSRVAVRIRVYEDDLGEFTVEYPVPNGRGPYSYVAFGTAAEALQRAREISRSKMWRIVDETLPDMGGSA